MQSGHRLLHTGSNLPTPVDVNRLESYLEGYEENLKSYLVDGFKNGFKLCYQGPLLTRISKNHKSAIQNSGMTEQMLKKELEKGRIAGPFQCIPFEHFISSPIGLIPKKETNKYRMIHDLSYPHSEGVNVFISKEDSTVSYETLDTVIALLIEVGRNALMAKSDIEEAFRIIPIHPSDYWLLGLSWDNQFYYDKCLAMGASVSCRIFESFSTALQWSLKNKLNINHVSHILDDFIFIGPKNSTLCQKSLETFIELCNELGIPIKHTKTVNACTVITVHGVELDSVRMESRLPHDKLTKGREIIARLQRKKKVTLLELQSAVGFLQFACKVIVPGRTFLRRLIDLSIGLSKPHHHVRITNSVRSDLRMWDDFFSDYNGRSFFLEKSWTNSEKIKLYTDASGAIGYGGVLGKRWFHGIWPDTWKHTDICIKEIFPITLAFEMWGKSLSNHKILIKSDNMAVVNIINSQTSRDPQVMLYLRRLVLVTLQYNIMIKAEHIPGKLNLVADYLSRYLLQEAREVAPWLNQQPSPIPKHLAP